MAILFKFEKQHDSENYSDQRKLHQYIENSDEKLLKLMSVLAKEYNEGEDPEPEFTVKDIKIFDGRCKKRPCGESNIYSRNEGREIIIIKNKPNEL